MLKNIYQDILLLQQQTDLRGIISRKLAQHL